MTDKNITHNFTHIILLSRNPVHLATSASFITSTSANVKVDTLPLDLADLPSIPSVLQKIEQLAPEIEVIYFNAAVVNFTETALSDPVSVLEKDFRVIKNLPSPAKPIPTNPFPSPLPSPLNTHEMGRVRMLTCGKVTNLALYTIAQWAIPRLQSLAQNSPTLKPSLLVTNSHLPWDPIPQLLSLSLVKAAQRNMVTSFARAYGGTGVRFGLVAVQGIVSPEAKVVSYFVSCLRGVFCWMCANGGDDVG